jgi:hypothetical protein
MVHEAVAGIGMSPPRGEEKTTDARTLTFRWDMVLTILAAVGAMYAATYSLRSDVRDILTRMELQAKIDAQSEQLLRERYEALKEDVASLTREDRMRQFELKALETRLLALEPKGKRP